MPRSCFRCSGRCGRQVPCQGSCCEYDRAPKPLAVTGLSVKRSAAAERSISPHAKRCIFRRCRAQRAFHVELECACDRADGQSDYICTAFRGSRLLLRQGGLIMGASIFTVAFAVILAVFFGWTSYNGRKSEREQNRK